MDPALANADLRVGVPPAGFSAGPAGRQSQRPDSGNAAGGASGGAVPNNSTRRAWRRCPMIRSAGPPPRTPISSGQTRARAGRGQRIVGVRGVAVQTQQEPTLVRTTRGQRPTSQQASRCRQPARNRLHGAARPGRRQSVQPGRSNTAQQNCGIRGVTRLQQAAGLRLGDRQVLGVHVPNPELPEQRPGPPFVRQQDGEPRTRRANRDLSVRRQQTAEILHPRWREVGGEE